MADVKLTDEERILNNYENSKIDFDEMIKQIKLALLSEIERELPKRYDYESTQYEVSFNNCIELFDKILSRKRGEV